MGKGKKGVGEKSTMRDCGVLLFFFLKKKEKKRIDQGGSYRKMEQ